MASVALAATFAPTVSAQQFLDTEPAEYPFTFSVRAGINTSNSTFPSGIFNQWNHNSWGTGVDAGIAVDLNMRDYFSIQPGIFFETRSGNYAYAHLFYNDNSQEDDFTQLGHYRSYTLNIPILFSARFNVSSSLRWIVEAGPYLQWTFHNTGKDKIVAIRPQASPISPVYTIRPETKPIDIGMKMGTGFKINDLFSVYVHYLAGCRRVWKSPVSGGHNKAWVFTVGYDF